LLLLIIAPARSVTTPTPAAATPAPASVPAPAAPANPGIVGIEIECQFIDMPADIAEQALGQSAADASASETPNLAGVFTAEEFARLVGSLHQKAGLDLLMAPRFTVKQGQKAKVKVVQEFPYPSEIQPGAKNAGILTPPTPTQFETRNVGVSLEVSANVISADRIEMDLSAESVAFLGFVNYHADRPALSSLDGDAVDEALKPQRSAFGVVNQPIFQTRKGITSVVMKSGQTVLVCGGLQGKRVADSQIEMAPDGTLVPSNQAGSGNTGEAEHSLFVFVTARLIRQDTDYKPAIRRRPPRPVSQKPLPKEKVPYGTPVP
jgi:general secretion pathway protein D